MLALCNSLLSFEELYTGNNTNHFSYKDECSVHVSWCLKEELTAWDISLYFSVYCFNNVMLLKKNSYTTKESN